MGEMALARLHTGEGTIDDALTTLRELAADAEKRHWINWALESRLALWQLLAEKHDPSAQSVLDALKTEAKVHGFKRILQLIDRRAS